ncbi:hypothetical protein BWQ96_08677 [Gracilariopsis chorda]|uniref:Uncharacterized protein n=1 Tax=Gracilariopsis chorda TaxID=448386 RepID=A0A2V3IKD8_9FLOR|nr:hypothetical protein BWQ96_08677 [Gracilariopsis chorda]|eukprot:PXF41590.1 hypothetical protein BWQ96_08677 [Gracilariopsis chorda]
MLIGYVALFYFHPSSKTFNKMLLSFTPRLWLSNLVGGLVLIVIARCKVDTDEAGDANNDKRKRILASRSQHLLDNRIVSFWSRILYTIHLLHLNFVRAVTWVGPNVTDANFPHAVVLVKGLMLYACTVAFSAPVTAVEQIFLELRSYVKSKVGKTSEKPAKRTYDPASVLLL